MGNLNFLAELLGRLADEHGLDKKADGEEGQGEGAEEERSNSMFFAKISP